MFLRDNLKVWRKTPYSGCGIQNKIGLFSQLMPQKLKTAHCQYRSIRIYRVCTCRCFDWGIFTGNYDNYGRQMDGRNGGRIAAWCSNISECNVLEVGRIPLFWKETETCFNKNALLQNGLFDYIEFTRTLKHGARDKDEEPAEQPPTPKSAKPSSGGGQQGQPQSPRGSVPQQPLTQGSAKSPSKPLQPPPRRR